MDSERQAGIHQGEPNHLLDITPGSTPFQMFNQADEMFADALEMRKKAEILFAQHAVITEKADALLSKAKQLQAAAGQGRSEVQTELDLVLQYHSDTLKIIPTLRVQRRRSWNGKVRKLSLAVEEGRASVARVEAFGDKLIRLRDEFELSAPSLREDSDDKKIFGSDNSRADTQSKSQDMALCPQSRQLRLSVEGPKSEEQSRNERQTERKSLLPNQFNPRSKTKGRKNRKKRAKRVVSKPLQQKYSMEGAGMASAVVRVVKENTGNHRKIPGLTRSETNNLVQSLQSSTNGPCIVHISSTNDCLAAPVKPPSESFSEIIAKYHVAAWKAGKNPEPVDGQNSRPKEPSGKSQAYSVRDLARTTTNVPLEALVESGNMPRAAESTKPITSDLNWRPMMSGAMPNAIFGRLQKHYPDYTDLDTLVYPVLSHEQPIHASHFSNTGSSSPMKRKHRSSTSLLANDWVSDGRQSHKKAREYELSTKAVLNESWNSENARDIYGP